MSIGKVLGGTVIATPAVGGGGYVIYKEVTKEETTTADTATSQATRAPDGATSSETQIPPAETRDDVTSQDGVLMQGENKQKLEIAGGEGESSPKPTDTEDISKTPNTDLIVKPGTEGSAEPQLENKAGEA